MRKGHSERQNRAQTFSEALTPEAITDKRGPWALLLRKLQRREGVLRVGYA